MRNAPQLPPVGKVPLISHVRALRGLGLSREQRRVFYNGNVAVYYFPTKTEPAIAILHWIGDRIRSGIVSIHDIGSGFSDLARWRTQSFTVARCLGAKNLELFGAAVVNPRLEALLLKHGYNRQTDTAPEVLGGGTMEIITKVLPVT